jgi:hypothetical protein
MVAARTFGISVTEADAIAELTNRRLQPTFVSPRTPMCPAAWPRQNGRIAFSRTAAFSFKGPLSRSGMAAKRRSAPFDRLRPTSAQGQVEERAGLFPVAMGLLNTMAMSMLFTVPTMTTAWSAQRARR